MTARSGPPARLRRQGLPPDAPFSVTEADGTLRILVAKDAGIHPGLKLPRSHQWIRGASARVIVDFANTSLLNSALVAWLFGLVHYGGLSSLGVANATRKVLAQLKQVGLDGIVREV